MSTNRIRPADLLAACVLLFATTPLMPAAIIYVDADATGANTGVTWEDACVDLQVALAQASAGDQIWVARGTYTPGPPGDVAATFQLLSGVEIYGGFAGGETEREQRDVLANPTLLSGDVGRDDVYGDPVWYLGWNINTDNSDHVVTGSGVDQTAVLDGFTIIAGYTTFGFGGGIRVVSGSPTLANCTVTRNLSGFASGGGMYVQDGSPVITDCTFRENYVHLGQGAGLYLYGDCAPVIADCLFVDNIDVGTGGGSEAAGAGISNHSVLPFAIERCAFLRNVSKPFYASGDDGGTYAGAIFHFGDALLTVRDSTFTGNTSNNGGAIYSFYDMLVVNCTFVDNDAPEYHASVAGWGGDGGGIGGLSFFGSLITIVNCDFAYNSAETGGGLRVDFSAEADVHNCIFWLNSDRNGNISSSQLKGAVAEYSCIQNYLVGEPGEDPPDPADFPGCIDLDPQFVDLPARDLHLAPGSPCIDAADNAAVPAWLDGDLDGNPRFADDPDTADTGLGTPPIVDMGAFEYAPAVDCPGDLDGDGTVGLSDLSTLLSNYGSSSGMSYGDGDLDGDGDVDLSDLSTLLAVFGTSCD